jgi:hypothetical protein
MQQAKFSITPSLSEFLSHYKQYGFKDKSAMVQAALDKLKKDFDQHSLRQSADLYAEVYAEDTELHDLTKTASDGWPE